MFHQAKKRCDLSHQSGKVLIRNISKNILTVIEKSRQIQLLRTIFYQGVIKYEKKGQNLIYK